MMGVEDCYIGQRVVCVSEFSENALCVGVQGVIRDIDCDYSVLVEFDEDVQGHDGYRGPGHKYKDGHCWWGPPTDLEPVNVTIEEFEIKYTFDDLAG